MEQKLNLVIPTLDTSTANKQVYNMNPDDQRGEKRRRDDEEKQREDAEKKKRLEQYEINQMPGRHIFGKKLMKKYKGGVATDTVYDVSITGKQWEGIQLVDLHEEMTQMWNDVLDTVRNDGVLPTDLIRIHISHRDLTKGDIKIPLQRLQDISAESIMDRIAAVLQSFSHLQADNILEISVGVIRFPRGEGVTRLAITNLNNLEKKQGLTLITNDDGKCLARSIVVSRAWQEKKNNKIYHKQ